MLICASSDETKTTTAVNYCKILWDCITGDEFCRDHCKEKYGGIGVCDDLVITSPTLCDCNYIC
ncbi:hypothetical protein LINGRAHAP2_LOCUS35852 [Linum grandiflorum]